MKNDTLPTPANDQTSKTLQTVDTVVEAVAEQVKDRKVSKWLAIASLVLQTLASIFGKKN